MVFCSSGDPATTPAASLTPSPTLTPSASPFVPNLNSRSVGRIKHVMRKCIISHKLRTPWAKYPKKRVRSARVDVMDLKSRKIWLLFLCNETNLDELIVTAWNWSKCHEFM